MTYFSRIVMDTRNSDAYHIAQMICKNSYSEHQQLWQMFDSDPDAGRDFVFRREQDRNGLRYYVVSQRQPHSSNKLWCIDTKPYSPKIQQNQRLVFSLRVNPVVTKKSPNGNSKRHDVIMDAKKKMNFKNLPVQQRPMLIDIIQEAGIKWLRTRAEKHGFSVEDDMIQVDAYEPHRGNKKPKNTKPIQYSTIDYTGTLTVKAPTLFIETLISGIGPAKAFGCGLLLIRPI